MSNPYPRGPRESELRPRRRAMGLSVAGWPVVRSSGPIGFGLSTCPLLSTGNLRSASPSPGGHSHLDISK